MIDQWFQNDIQKIIDDNPVAVIIDKSEESEFLLETVKNQYNIYQTSSELEELEVKYLIEKDTQEKPALIYTKTEKKYLKFIREYCEIYGNMEITSLQSYVKEKVHKAFNLNINLPAEEILAAAKISVGKDRTYWMDLSHKGSSEIFDLSKELLPFLHDPESFDKNKYDEKIRETFYKKINELLKQDYVEKPAKTLAQEVVHKMLDNLAAGVEDKILDNVYFAWLDSMTFQSSFSGYLSQYKLPDHLDIWQVNINHPFRQIDIRWMKEIGEHLTDKGYIAGKIGLLEQRQKNKQAQVLELNFMKDIVVLLKFDVSNIYALSTFQETVNFYTEQFYRLDTAIRSLYANFLSEKDLLEPYQNLYKEYLSIFLEKWFRYWPEYQETQTGTLQHIIEQNKNIRTAVIVGDGISYEIAVEVSQKVSEQYKLKKEIVLADLPTETENNMSRIYINNGLVEPVQSNREKHLSSNNPDSSIDYTSLDDFSGELQGADISIFTSKDVDSMGEKLQQKALKYFPELISNLAEKISRLLQNGFQKVYLIADHGFVLTGILNESDKISLQLEGNSKISERYIRTVEKQTALIPYIEIEKKYNEYEYLYLAKNISPFKSPGLYGFSHGGASPQEIITPFFCWETAQDTTPSLTVAIQNKTDLQSVTGQLFQIKISGNSAENSLYSNLRKVFLVFFAEGKQINKSEFFEIKDKENISKEYGFDGYNEIEVQVLDAATKQLLDKAVIKQNNMRDLGGLL